MKKAVVKKNQEAKATNIKKEQAKQAIIKIFTKVDGCA